MMIEENLMFFFFEKDLKKISLTIMNKEIQEYHRRHKKQVEGANWQSL